jgi:hypothetical protein
VQPISIPQVNRRHPNSSSPFISTVILLDRLAPELARLGGTIILPETDIDQEVAVVEVWDEVRGRELGGPFVDVGREEVRGIPAVELAGAIGFVVERGAEGDNSGDLDTNHHQKIGEPLFE